MIDFPAAPTNGQLFSAPNGVIYQWSTTYSSWLAQNPTPPIGGTGDFYANQTSSYPALVSGSAVAVLILTQVITGNSGGWYNTGTGRYTPPAGRYQINAAYSATAAAGTSHMRLYLRKNGVDFQTIIVSSSVANNYAEPSVSAVVDANGTDYFEIAGSSSAGTGTFASLTFQAFPLTGMQGPAGPSGQALPSGAIIDFAGAAAPTGFLLCNGASYTTAAQPNLFAAIGYAYGGSGGNFNVPDLGGRVTAGKEATATRLTTAGSGIDGSVVGAAGGAQNEALGLGQLPSGTASNAAFGAAFSSTGGYPSPSNFLYNITQSAPVSHVQPTIIMNKIIKT